MLGNSEFPKSSVFWSSAPANDSKILGVMKQAGHWVGCYTDSLDKLRTSPWKPFTLRNFGLGSLLAFTVLLLVVVEAFRQISRRNGGILFADGLDNLSGAQTFAYLYLPTIIAVIYSIAWAWVDLDVKRIEPYFQLSKAEGPIASSSMLLSYSHDFPPFVPIKATRRKYLPPFLHLNCTRLMVATHWAVVYSGTVMLLIFWGITPFQNAVIGQSDLQQTRDVRYTRSSGLIPLQQQLHALSAESFYTGFNVAWLKLQPPPFMTSKAAYDAA